MCPAQRASPPRRPGHSHRPCRRACTQRPAQAARHQSNRNCTSSRLSCGDSTGTRSTPGTDDEMKCSMCDRFGAAITNIFVLWFS